MLLFDMRGHRKWHRYQIRAWHPWSLNHSRQLPISILLMQEKQSCAAWAPTSPHLYLLLKASLTDSKDLCKSATGLFSKPSIFSCGVACLVSKNILKLYLKWHQKENSPTFVYSLSTCLRQSVFAERGGGRGGVLFYEQSSSFPCRTKPPSATEMEGEMLSQERRWAESQQETHDLESRHWREAATVPIPEAWDTKEMRKTSRNHLTLKGPPWRREAERHRAVGL